MIRGSGFVFFWPPLNQFVLLSARILIDGPRAHEAMFAAMAAARDHIHLETYILEAGEVGERLATLLGKKVDEGVKVNVMYDA